MEIDRPISIAIMIFVILLLAFLLVVPEYKNFKSLQQELGEKRAEFNAEFEYYAEISRIYFDLNSPTRQKDVEKIDDALPTDPALGKDIYFIQEKAKESGMLLKSLSLSKSAAASRAVSNSSPAPVKNAAVQDIVFSLNLLGSYDSLGKFISALEKSTRIFEITTISFGSGSDRLIPTTEEGSEPQNQFDLQETFNFNMQLKTHAY